MSNFEYIRIIFHGGPKDGANAAIHKGDIYKSLQEVEEVRDIVLCRFPTSANKDRYHIYMSNGPIDFALFGSDIDVYYEGIKDK